MTDDPSHRPPFAFFDFEQNTDNQYSEDSSFADSSDTPRLPATNPCFTKNHSTPKLNSGLLITEDTDPG
ncbi:hypothetical protein HK100_009082, partial [Physocladia obscura]